jgi:plastocyanin
MADHQNSLIITKLNVLEVIMLSCIIFSLFSFTIPYALGQIHYIQLQEQKIEILRGASQAIDQKGFSPDSVSVNAGTLITWVNNDNTIHTVTFATPGVYDSGLIASGKSVTHTFLDQGTFNYYCKIHPFMTANITVS